MTNDNNTQRAQRWYAVRVRQAAEYVAETEMRRVRLAVYLPQFLRKERDRRSKAWILRQYPLFPGYIFLDASTLKWPSLTSCKGVEWGDGDPIICDVNGKPIPIDGETIKRIRDNEECGAFDETPESRLVIGEPIAIATGALAGMEGPLSRVRGHHVQILSALFGGTAKINAPMTALTKLAS